MAVPLAETSILPMFRPQTAVMQSGSNQHRINFALCQAVQICRAANSSAGNDFNSGVILRQLTTEVLGSQSFSQPDSCQVQNDQPANPELDSLGCDGIGIRFNPMFHVTDRLSLFKIQRENDWARSQILTKRFPLFRAGQRFQPDNH